MVGLTACVDDVTAEVLAGEFPVVCEVLDTTEPSSDALPLGGMGVLEELDATGLELEAASLVEGVATAEEDSTTAFEELMVTLGLSTTGDVDTPVD